MDNESPQENIFHPRQHPLNQVQVQVHIKQLE